MVYAAHPTLATNVPVFVESGGKESPFNVDQSTSLPEAAHFRPVGVVALTAGTESTVVLGNKDTNGFVILAALQFTSPPKID